MSRLKLIFKKFTSSHNRISFLGNFIEHRNIRDNEYVNFFIGWQYAAITAIGDSVSSLQFRLADKNDNDITHEYLSYVTPELLGSIATFMKLCGTAYVWKVVLHGKVVGLSILLPWNIFPNIDEYGNLISWNYCGGSGSIVLGVDEVLVFAEFNPYQRYPYITRGYSPLQALAMTVKGEEKIEEWNYGLLTHDVPPGMILTTNEGLTEEQLRAITEAWESRHTGAANVGRLAILPFGIKPAALQSSPKEMEFISQQSWDRDKILAIYKVPKAVLGIGEGVNVGNVKAFNQIFASRCIDPLAKKISRILNDKLFKDIGVFEFLNVLPSDEEEVRQHYLSGGITKNEYRIEIGYKPIKGGDIFVDGSECKVDSITNNSLTSNDLFHKVNFKSIVNKYIPWSEEWMIERWKVKQLRLSKYEELLKLGLIKIFSKQEEDILRLIDKKVKGYNRKELSYLGKKYYSLYYVVLKETVTNIVLKEGKRSLDEIHSDKEFIINDPIIVEGIKELINILASNVDKVTDERLRLMMGEAINEGVSKEEIKEIVEKVFNELKTTRLETIIRTESARFSNFAEHQARDESGLVKYKQWWTAEDERRCDECYALHGKRIKLNEKFKKDVMGAPLHPNCRCDLIPVIE